MAKDKSQRKMRKVKRNKKDKRAEREGRKEKKVRDQHFWQRFVNQLLTKYSISSNY